MLLSSQEHSESTFEKDFGFGFSNSYIIFALCLLHSNYDNGYDIYYDGYSVWLYIIPDYMIISKKFIFMNIHLNIFKKYLETVNW